MDREVSIYGTFEEPLFMAKDVAGWIEHSDVSTMIRAVDETEKVTNIVCTPGGNQSAWFLTEDGLYEVLMQSRKPIAKAFKRQVKAYLKELRTKGLTATPDKIEEMLNNPDVMIQALTQLKEERQQRHLAESRARVAEGKAALLDEVNRHNMPKVLFADSVAASNGIMLVGDLAKVLKQNGVEIGAMRLFDFLRENGYLIKRKGTDHNMPTQRSMDLGLFEIKETAIYHASGDVSINKTPRVTGKGQIYFVNKFLYKKNQGKVKEAMEMVEHMASNYMGKLINKNNQ